MIVLRTSLLDTLMQIFIILWHLVAEISRFKFDDYRVSRKGASDLKLFWGSVYPTRKFRCLINVDPMVFAIWVYTSAKYIDSEIVAYYLNQCWHTAHIMEVSVNFESKYRNIHFRKCIWKRRLQMTAILSPPQGIENNPIMFLCAKWHNVSPDLIGHFELWVYHSGLIYYFYHQWIRYVSPCRALMSAEYLLMNLHFCVWQPLRAWWWLVSGSVCVRIHSNRLKLL